MLCEWPGVCEHQVAMVTLTGCLNLHVRQYYFCSRHSADWVNAIRTGMVPCTECLGKLSEYLVHAM